uniref:Uncharacterized protein n=1 Tax=Anguilla anguilla TaxID=7936 RepID=A0A0E9VT35_ANGAN
MWERKLIEQSNTPVKAPTPLNVSEKMNW